LIFGTGRITAIFHCGGTYELQRERLIKCARLRAQIGAKRRRNHAGELSVPSAVGLGWSNIWKIWISFVISIWRFAVLWS